MSLDGHGHLSYSQSMYSRRDIVNPGALAHAFFRCHNRQHFFADVVVKIFLLFLWARYKGKYKIKIFDFAILDNHAHMFLQAKDAEHLGNFMRTVNSQLARFINKRYHRDSQAIRERYKSPIITNIRYLHNLVGYIWLNRHKVDGSDPRVDRFVSLSWRLHYDMIKASFSNEKDADLLDQLLDSYDELPTKIDSSYRGLINFFNEAMKKSKDLIARIYENAHTIGDKADVEYRGEYLSSFRHQRVPWSPIIV